jgi:hypothetical protein
MSTPQQQEQQKKMIAYAVFGALIVGLGIYEYETNFADNSPPPQTATVQPRVDPALANKPVVTTRIQSAAPNSGTGVAAGVAATRMASTSSSLDPTLDERAMLRTENLVYSGNGRNIFSQAAYIPVAALPKNLPSARPVAAGPVLPPPPPPTCPPTCAPIGLKYFGTVVQSNGQRQAFLLHDEDVYMASQGDIVARRYKIVSITANGVQVEDLSNGNKQNLPLLAQ